MAGLREWLITPGRPVWASSALTGVIAGVGMGSTLSIWDVSLFATSVAAGFWAFVGAVSAKLILERLAK